MTVSVHRWHRDFIVSKRNRVISLIIVRSQISCHDPSPDALEGRSFFGHFQYVVNSPHIECSVWTCVNSSYWYWYVFDEPCDKTSSDYLLFEVSTVEMSVHLNCLCLRLFTYFPLLRFRHMSITSFAASTLKTPLSVHTALASATDILVTLAMFIYLSPYRNEFVRLYVWLFFSLLFS